VAALVLWLLFVVNAVLRATWRQSPFAGSP